MRKFMTLFFAMLFSLGLLATDADAGRLGGGRSMGKQRESVTHREAQRPPAAAAAPAAAAQQPMQPQPSGARKWLGPLAGLAAGGLIASMLFGHGAGGALAGMINVLMIALLVVGGVWLALRLFRRQQPADRFATQGAGAPFTPRIAEPLAAGGWSGAAPAAASVSAPMVPAGFDVEGFVRHAKVNFVRLQTANDAGNLDDIRDFTTPEMFAEISLGIKERGGATQRTDVVTLDAELLEVVTDAGYHIASVRFSGMLREREGVPAEPFKEVWNLQKQVDGKSGWLLAGIQQL